MNKNMKKKKKYGSLATTDTVGAIAKMEPFDVLNMGNISDFHLEHSNPHFFTFSNSRTPLFVKKKSSDYRVYGTQNDWLEPTISTQKSILKKMHLVQRYWQKGKRFLTFCLKS